MRKIYSLLLLSALTLVGCSSDNDSPEQAFELEATGTVAEQTPEEARKTINGKWNIGGSSSSKFSAAKGLNCTFVGIEFTDDRFAIAIDVNDSDDELVAYGTYELTEGSDGNVASVDLYENVDGTNYKIATLTNIEVSETANELNATFDVVFNIPANYDGWPCGASLSGNYSAEKEEPVNGADEADQDSNFAKLIKTWTITNYTDSDGGSLEEVYNAPCFDLYDEIYAFYMSELFPALYQARVDAFIAEQGDEALTQEVLDALVSQVEGELSEEVDALTLTAVQDQCEPAAKIEVSFSAYGSYIFNYFGSDGSSLETWVDSWEFNNADQTEILVDGEFVLTIDQLTDSTLIVSEQDEDGFSSTYTFSKVN